MKLKLVRDDGLILNLDKKFPVFLTDVQGLDGLPVNIYKYSLAEQDGANYVNSVFAERTINIYCTIKSNALDSRRFLLQFFNPKHDITIYIDDKYKINGRTSSTPKFSREVNYYRGLIDIECLDPYITDINPSTVIITTIKPLFKFAWKVNDTKMGLKDENLIADIINQGDVPSGFIIDFKALSGVVVNPSIVNMSTREILKINTTLNTGDIIRVNTIIGQKNVEKIENNISKDAFELIDTDFNFMQLPIGKNRIRYNADEGMTNLMVTMIFNNRYLGI